MSLAISIDVSGLAPIEQLLGRLDPLQTDTLLESLARMIRDQIRERLIAGGPSPSGAAWAPNKEGRKPILHRSGGLARSIDYAVAGNQAVVGSGLPQAAILHFGGTIVPKSASRLVFKIGNRQIFAKKVTMPARPYVGLSGEDRALLVRAAMLYIRRLFG